jgi:hypothetical protein
MTGINKNILHCYIHLIANKPIEILKIKPIDMNLWYLNFRNFFVRPQDHVFFKRTDNIQIRKSLCDHRKRFVGISRLKIHT